MNSLIFYLHPARMLSIIIRQILVHKFTIFCEIFQRFELTHNFLPKIIRDSLRAVSQSLYLINFMYFNLYFWVTCMYNVGIEGCY